MNCSSWVAALDAGHLGRPHEMGRAAPGWRRFSQSYQDGVLERVFDLFGTESKRFVEFGLGYTEGSVLTEERMDKLQLNTRALVKARGWTGVYFDALVEDPRFGVRRALLTRRTIGSAFEWSNVEGRLLDYVSIDVDSVDAWLLLGMLEHSNINPRVISVEYNGNFLASDAVSMNETWVPWRGRSMHGASAKAIVDIASQFGYRLLYLMSYFDLFLIREDVLASKCDPASVPSLERQAREKLPTKQHLQCKAYEVDRMVDARFLLGKMGAEEARSRARDAIERAEEELFALRKRGLRPTCCARTGTPVCEAF